MIVCTAFSDHHRKVWNNEKDTKKDTLLLGYKEAYGSDSIAFKSIQVEKISFEDVFLLIFGFQHEHWHDGNAAKLDCIYVVALAWNFP